MSVISDQNDLSDSVSMTSDYDDHEDCPLHHDPRQGLCYSLTYAKTACKYKAKITTPGYLPVCQTHRPRPWKEALRAGKCQATELCGHICNRLSHHAPPFHLCVKHQNGSNTLPCHLMELPTELRLMIFRYLFPDVIPAEKWRVQHGQGVKAAILKVSRQIYLEASSVLYGESIFRAAIRSTGIEIQGQTWDRTPTARNKENDYSADNLLGRHGTSSIQNLEIDIELGIKNTCPRGIGKRGITQEDYQIFAIRDAVRKMSNLLRVQPTSRSSSALKRLTVKPVIHLSGYSWNSDQAIIAMFSVLEPLQRLQVQNPRLEAPNPYHQPWLDSVRTSDKQIITNMSTKKAYVKLEKQWLKALKEAWASSSRLEPSVAVQEGFRKIEAFTQLIHVQGATTAREWTSTIFQHLERPLHLARIAYENDDMEKIEKIQEAIKLRWINAHRVQQRTLRAVADSINNMFERDDGIDEMDDDGGAPTPRELYPDAFEFEEVELLKEPYSSGQVHDWVDLSTKDPAPPCNDPGVTVQFSALRLRIQKDGKEWMRLKTPAIVRQLAEEKKSSDA
jgi:hypothetical protein